MQTYVFDGTLPGLLTAIFESYERKATSVRIESRANHQPALMGDTLIVVSDEQKARRVWHGLAKHMDAKWLARWYAAFLAERASGYQHLFELSRLVFDQGGAVIENYGNAHVLHVAQLDRKVHREKHRMEAFVRFQQLADGLYYAAIEPDFDVLPLISGHFKNRYADQRWVIYDLKRAYGLYYDGQSVNEVTFGFEDAGKQGIPGPNQLAEDERHYQDLWRSYFNHTNISVRKNTRLHIRHVPVRYWKYLTEKGYLFDR